MSKRIVQEVIRGKEISVFVNGNSVTTYEGETIAAALLTAGYKTFHLMQSGSPRAPFCNMGTCFTCRVKISDGTAESNETHNECQEPSKWVRACMTPVANGMTITTGKKL